MDRSNQSKRLVLDRLLEHYGFQHWWESENRLADWLTMILIQQTTDKNAQKALDALADHLTFQQLQAIDEETLQQLIRPAGFYKQKSAYIKALVTWFDSHGNSFEGFADVPTEALRKELLTIKGVGQETADVMLLYLFKRNVFVADQYGMRLFNRLGFGPYQNYTEMRRDFQELTQEVPNEICREWHAVIDVHGKAFRKNKDLDESWLLQR